MTPARPGRSACAAIALLAAQLGQVAMLQAQAAAEQKPPLKSLSIEELLEVDVSLPLGRDERVMDAPAAIAILTSEDLHRLGPVTLPEALRTVPGMFVARFNASSWIITTRGFASTVANKMLVMIDGRSVYSPLFSGVFWDQQDVMLDDLDRIEIVRGPGGSLWGSNAVNGVINVVSKRASETQGTLVTIGGGAEERFNGSVRYGGTAGEGFYRVYGKYFDRDSAVLADGSDAHDGQRFGQGGFRMDFGPEAHGFTLQGDAYATNTDLLDRNDIAANGMNVLGRWSRRPSASTELQIQAYFDHTYRMVPEQFRESRNTFDVDIEQRWAAGPRNNIRVAGGYRYGADETVPTVLLAFDPADRATSLLSASAQDETAWSTHISTILGTRVEHNDYTGVEWQPNVRIRWTPTRAHTVWAAVSRAVRMPTRLDTDVRVLQNGRVIVAGNPDFESETLVAYELGYRTSPRRNVAIGAQIFQHHYDDLRTQEPVAGPVPIRVGNGLNAVTSGVQVNGSVEPRSWMRFTGSYTFLSHDLSLDADSHDVANGMLETIDPRHQGQLLARFDLPRQLQLDLTTRFVGKLPNPGTPAYNEAGFRLGWRAIPQIELAVIGRDILHADHLEFVSPTSSRLTRLQRAIFTGATLTF